MSGWHEPIPPFDALAWHATHSRWISRVEELHEIAATDASALELTDLGRAVFRREQATHHAPGTISHDGR